jgi:2-hydroxymethylglutarate dehydrogenase
MHPLTKGTAQENIRRDGMKIGFIGTGQIGSRMAMRLLNAGYELFIHDIRKEATAKLLEAGAKWADTPAKAAESAEITITSLPGPVEVEDVALGPNGVIGAAKEGHVYLDTTSSYPSLIQRIAAKASEKNVYVVDAPLTGGVWGAETGTLIFIVGGDREAIDKVRPILDILAKKVYHMGPSGSGNAAKLVNNMIGQIETHAFAEAFALAAKFGLDLKQVLEFLSNADVGSGILTKYYANKGLKGDFEPGFSVDLAYKDQTLISKLGQDLGVPLYFNALVLQRLAENRAKGNGRKDITAALLPLEDLLKIRMRIE